MTHCIPNQSPDLSFFYKQSKKKVERNIVIPDHLKPYLEIHPVYMFIYKNKKNMIDTNMSIYINIFIATNADAWLYILPIVIFKSGTMKLVDFQESPGKLAFCHFLLAISNNIMNMKYNHLNQLPTTIYPTIRYIKSTNNTR